MTHAHSAGATPSRSKTITFLSTHFYQQKRRGGFHWLADAFHAMGWRVRFITIDCSLLSQLRSSGRYENAARLGKNRLEEVRPGLQVGYLQTLLHPIGHGRSAIKRLVAKATAFYPGLAAGNLRKMVSGSDVVVLESNAGLLLAPMLRRWSIPMMIYRVSDNISAIRPLAALLEAERDAARIVDFISVASPSLAEKFRTGGGRVVAQPMGLDKEIFDQPSANPYPESASVKVVCSGSSLLDMASFVQAAKVKPDWSFYIFGHSVPPTDASNVHIMGEVPFKELVPFVKHADIGFAPYIASSEAVYQAHHSNRILQYMYCELPILVPDILKLEDRKDLIGYKPGDGASLAAALDVAAAMGKKGGARHLVRTWSEIAAEMEKHLQARFPELT